MYHLQNSRTSSDSSASLLRHEQAQYEKITLDGITKYARQVSKGNAYPYQLNQLLKRFVELNKRSKSIDRIFKKKINDKSEHQGLGRTKKGSTRQIQKAIVDQVDIEASIAKSAQGFSKSLFPENTIDQFGGIQSVTRNKENVFQDIEPFQQANKNSIYMNIMNTNYELSYIIIIYLIQNFKIF